MKIIISSLIFFITIIFFGCNEEVIKPKDNEILFYKIIDTTVFKGDIFVSLTSHQDTINENGTLKIIDLPTTNIHIVNGRMSLINSGYFFISEDNITFSQTSNGFASGVFQFADPFIIFSYDITNQAQEKLYIKLATLENGSHFVVGVNVK